MDDLFFDLQRFTNLTNDNSYSVVSGSYGNDNITNWGSYSTIYGYSGDDYLVNAWSTSGVRLYGGLDDDTIKNYGTQAYLSGDFGDDLIQNGIGSYYGDTVTIDGGFGDDTIENNKNFVSINGGFGDDQISLSEAVSSNTVNGGFGDDVIYGYSGSSYGVLYQYNLGEGYDTIYNWNSSDTLSLGSGIYYTRNTVNSNVLISIQGGGAVTLSGAKGKTVNIKGGSLVTTINNTVSGKTIYGNYYNDTISNSGSDVKIYGYEGNDSISNTTANRVTIDAGEGNDTLRNGNYNFVSMSGGAGNDVIYNSANDVTMSGGAGYDSIVVENPYAYVTTIDGGLDDDTIQAYGGSINAGAGNDRISLGSYLDSAVKYGATVKGGAGNDILYSDTSGNGVLYQYNSGDGYDTIYNWNSSDTLSLGSGIYYTRSTLSGSSDVLISIQSGGAVTLSGASSKTVNIKGGTLVSNAINNYISNTVVSGSANADTINNYASYVTIQAGAGNDKIYNDYVNYVSVNGGTGKDSISNYSAWYSTVDAGDGADTIVVPYRAWQDSINGGADNDRISLSSSSDNYNGKNTIVGGKGNDTIYGNATHTIGNVYQYNSGDGYDSILNWNSNDTLNLGGLYYTRDTLKSNVLISISGGGAITLGGASSKTLNITGGTEIKKNIIYNYTSNTAVSGSANADTINNYGSYVTVNAGDGKDSVYNSAYNVTINASAGADTVNNSSGDYVFISGGTGNDSILGYSYNWYDTVDGGKGNDTIVGFGKGSSINGGAGADRVSLGYASDTRTVRGGTGNDTLYGYSGSTYGVLYQYDYGDGYDSIINWNNYDTLSFGTGTNVSYYRDTVGSNVVFKIEGGGAITISGGNGKTINVKGGVDLGKTGKGTLISNSSSNVKLTGTAYADTISNSYGGNVTINAGKGNDTIYNWADKVTVNAGAGKDTLSGGYSNSKINGEDGNDLITLTGAYWRNTINGGADNDTIIAGGNEHSVFGGAGADRISLSGDKLTVNGGTGNDTIYGSTATSHLYEYKKGDGDDLIYNWSSNDTLTITGGASWTKSNSGSNVIITVKDSGKITLSGAKGKTVNVYPTTNPTISSDTVTPQDVIKKFMKSLDTTSYSGISALNQAVSAATGGYFSNINSAINQMIDDCSRTGNAAAFLKNYCGIDLTNADTGAITGYDAGGSTYQKTADDIIPESGNADDATESSFKTGGLTVYLSQFDRNGNNTYAINYNNLTDNREKYIWRAFEKWWASGALNLIAESYGSNYSFNSSSTANILNFGFYKQSDGEMAVTRGWFADSSRKTINKLTMGVNMNNYSTLIIDDPDGKLSGGDNFRLDRVLAHEFTHAVMYANVNYVGDLPDYIMEGFAELTHGTDDDRKSEITKLAGNATALKNALQNDCYDSYAGGYMFLRYLAKQGAAHYPTSSSSSYATASSRAVSKSNSSTASSDVSIKSGLLTVSKDFAENLIDLSTYSSSVKKVNATALISGIMIIGNQSANSISAGAGADTISANTGNDTVLGGAGNDLLYGDAGNDKLYGNEGNDSISGGTGNDSLWGGAGKDVFIHKADNDYIYDYVTGEDKIKLAEEYAAITAASLNGSDVVLTISDDNSITIKDGKDKKITIVDYDGKSTSSVYGGGKNLTLTNKSKAAVTLDAAYQNVNASKRTKAIKITGNALDNTILGSSKNDSLYGLAGNDSLVGNAGADKLYGGAGADTLVGGAGNDSLWGGAGNDSLWGGAGADTFVYKPGEGTDKIFDYESGDLLTILKSDGKAGGTFKKSVFNNSTLTLTISGGGSVVFDGVAAGDKFNINGKSYTISGTKLK